MTEVWWVLTAAVREAGLVARCEAVLEPHEVAAQRSHLFERNRHEYLVTRALCRGVLAQRVGVAPSELRFVRSQYGRPRLEPAGRFEFNLSNTVELVVLAVSDGAEVGVDAEKLSRGEEVLSVASTVFTDGEQARLARASAEQRAVLAVELWTLKEAYMKARGLGFSLPPREFELEPGESGLRVRCEAAVDPEPGRWRFTTLHLEGHAVSVCTREEPAPPSFHAADLAQLLTPPRLS